MDETKTSQSNLESAIDLLTKRCAEIDGHYKRIPNAGREPRETADAIRTLLCAVESEKTELSLGDLKAAFLWGYAKGSGGGLSAGDQDWLLYRRALSGNA